ncbi:BPSS1780 family membrane protein [uncultured Rhodoferax sp.]|uniref:BPSS1780 family membrane protein n=1 Tax=uncultured Rhodoferax sp. TaxID=223188 RepID=UPI0025E01CE6|nr:BPSS1780 family membrane protein [uncultured Rhodoferax sp.]
MKLRLVPARQGAVWVKQGIQAFARQPLGLMGLLFLFMASMTVLSLLPLLGSIIALTLLPAATLGLMVATREIGKGRFPMPTVLVAAFRAGRQQLRAMLVLGLLYALSLFIVLGLSAAVDGGQFARLYLGGGGLSEELASQASFQNAATLATLLYIPVSLLFWHAPALVHWHQVPPVKSLFFSLVACLRNFWAFTVFGVSWALLLMTTGLVISSVAILLGNPEMLGVVLMPFGLISASMFFASLYFSFNDCFEAPPGDTDDTAHP